MSLKACRRLIGSALLVVVLVSSWPHSASKGTQSPRLPLVLSASVPFYPALPRKAGISGDVRVSVTTDGKRAIAFHILASSPMLDSATIEIIKTWQFQEHAPTTFETVFRYRLLPDTECYFDAPTVQLHLPDAVEITAKRVMTCDPLSESSDKGATGPK